MVELFKYIQEYERRDKKIKCGNLNKDVCLIGAQQFPNRPRMSAQPPAKRAKKISSGPEPSLADRVLILDSARAPGYLSEPLRGLTSPDLVVNGEASYTEKGLVGKGTRKVTIVDGVVVEYAGVRKAKFVTKDADRFCAMLASVRGEREDENLRGLVLLGAEQEICRKNTLKRLFDEGIVVQRCSS